MDAMDHIQERGRTVDQFLQMKLIGSRMQVQEGRTFRIEDRECPQTGLKLTCRFPVPVGNKRGGRNG